VSNKRLTVAIPASFIADTPHLREKTSKIGLVGRAAAIFKVDEVIVYRDNPQAGQDSDSALIELLLAYLETPQYLRKRRFQLDARLQYAGILPPLRTPHHPLSGKAEDLRVGEYREGVVLSKTRDGALVDIGTEQPALLAGRQFTVDKRLTVRLMNVGERVEVAIANRMDIQEYWGYAVSTAESLRQMVEKGSYGLRIATSKKGAVFSKIAGELAEKWRRTASVLVVLGSPTRGLYEIAKDEGARLDDLVDFVVNTIPSQGTETVRTEEALLATLAVLNIHFSL
jgi:predicted SPOUT superfamily RNA methylase MTH1